MSDSPFVPIEEVIAVLEESGEHASKRTVYNDIAADRIPGEFRVTGKRYFHRVPRIKRAEWNKYLAGEDWRTPARKPISIVSLNREAS